MIDQLTTCPRCTSDACYHIDNEGHNVWFCYGCGFMSDSTKKAGTDILTQFEETLPELYKALKYADKELGCVFYPSVINIPTKGMVFADGNSTLDWKWAAVVATEIPENEKNKFPPSQTHKMDMTTIQHFDEKDFMDALEHIGYYN
jgi:hypothetical protein